MPDTPITLRIPSELDSCALYTWFCADGVWVKGGQPFAEIAHHAAFLSMTAPVSGRLEHLVTAGTELSAGAPIAVLDPALTPEAEVHYRALLDAVLADPENDEPRRVLGEWLVARGAEGTGVDGRTAEETRTRGITIGAELAGTAPGGPRDATWLDPAGSSERGFLVRAWYEAPPREETPPGIGYFLDDHPLRELEVDNVNGDWLRDALQHPRVGTLEKLRLCIGFQADGVVEALGDALSDGRALPHLALDFLHASGQCTAVARALADIPVTSTRIRELRVPFVEDGDPCAESLSAAPALAGLRELVLSGWLTHRGLHALTVSPNLPELREVAGVKTDVAGLVALLHPRAGAPWSSVSVHLVGMNATAAQTAATAPAAPWLRFLRIDGDVDADSLGIFLRSPLTSALEELRIDPQGHGMTGGDAIAQAVVEASASGTLRRLTLFRWGITDLGAQILSRARLPRLERLDLCVNFISIRGALALGEAPGLARAQIDLGSTPTEKAIRGPSEEARDAYARVVTRRTPPVVFRHY